MQSESSCEGLPPRDNLLPFLSPTLTLTLTPIMPRLFSLFIRSAWRLPACLLLGGIWLAAALPQVAAARELNCERRSDMLSRVLCPDSAMVDADRQVDALLAEARRTMDPAGRKELEVRHSAWRAELAYHCDQESKARDCAATQYRQHLDFLSSPALRWFGEWQAPGGKRLVVTPHRERVSVNVSSRAGAAVGSAPFGPGELRLSGESRLAGQLQRACLLQVMFGAERGAADAGTSVRIRFEGDCGGYDPSGMFLRPR